MAHTHPAAREIATTIRRHRLTYATFHKYVGQARKLTGLHPSRSHRHLPRILSEESLRKYFDAVSRTEDKQHELMLRLLFNTAVRVSELCAMKIGDVDLQASKIFIESGKGDKDRYVLFGSQLRGWLKSHMDANHGNTYLFESRMKRRYSTRRIHQIVVEYADKAGLEERVHPHLFRHQMLTWLTKQGLSDSQIQLISGHTSKETLEKYQHVGLGDVAEDYQEAVRKVNV